MPWCSRANRRLSCERNLDRDALERRTRRQLAPWAVLLASIAWFASACAHAPYRGHAPPSADELLARTEPQFAALTIPKATLRPTLTRRLDLMMVAQSPDRFRATVQVAGNELVSVALNETGYTLRNLVDQGLAMGFYAGPPAACALEYLIGLSLPPPDFVRVILGGAPPLDPPGRVVDQHWERRRPGAEVLVLENQTHRQTMWLRFVAGKFWVARVERAELTKKGPKLQWWVEHDDLHHVAGGVLPRRTVFAIAASNAKISIDYHEQLPNPAIEAPASAAADAWDESDDEGWEEVDGTAAVPSAGPSTQTTAPPSSTSAVPPMFQLDGAGLSPRGDVCSRPN